jgi:phosphatidylethanolamine/phosphatidyl-N-methylethanolamine N-methyltransferase
MKSLDAQSIRRVYRWYAPMYDLVFGRPLQRGRLELAEKVKALAPSHLLEIGVGTGLSLPHYPRMDVFCGIDLSAEMLARARALLPQVKAQAGLLACADAEHLPFADGSFDCVTLPYVLSVTPNPKRLLAEVDRVCRPAATVLVLNHFRGAGVWQLAERLVEPLAHRVGFHSTISLESTLEGSQFQLEEVRKVNLFGLSKLVQLKKPPV